MISSTVLETKVFLLKRPDCVSVIDDLKRRLVLQKTLEVSR